VDAERLVRRHGPVDEAEARAAGVQLAQLREDPALVPEGQDRLLEARMIGHGR
jgi:hypothetical protein